MSACEYTCTTFTVVTSIKLSGHVTFLRRRMWNTNLLRPKFWRCRPSKHCRPWLDLQKNMTASIIGSKIHCYLKIFPFVHFSCWFTTSEEECERSAYIHSSSFYTHNSSPKASAASPGLNESHSSFPHNLSPPRTTIQTTFFSLLLRIFMKVHFSFWALLRRGMRVNHKGMFWKGYWNVEGFVYSVMF
jgi:hypothetical protein